MEFGSQLWAQLQKVRVTKDQGIQTPVKADGVNGIVIGDPPLDVGVPRPRPAGKPRRRLRDVLLGR